MKQLTKALIALAVISASIASVVHFSRPSQAQARGADVQLISLPPRAGTIYHHDQEYSDEEHLERYFSQGYELEAVIEDTRADSAPILVFRK
jgi:hypothetical protein